MFSFWRSGWSDKTTTSTTTKIGGWFEKRTSAAHKVHKNPSIWRWVREGDGEEEEGDVDSEEATEPERERERLLALAKLNLEATSKHIKVALA